ncbi:MAG: hypothetical protein KGJ66_04215 [Alphaproteobacteria bacterium]|nr:hypothetical protein [Alphaproteobacteria bacterium]
MSAPAVSDALKVVARLDRAEALRLLALARIAERHRAREERDEFIRATRADFLLELSAAAAAEELAGAWRGARVPRIADDMNDRRRQLRERMARCPLADGKVLKARTIRQILETKDDSLAADCALNRQRAARRSPS